MESRDRLDRGLSSVARGTLVMFVASLALIVETFLWRVVLVRTLSPAEWSVFALGFAYAGLLVTVGRLGLGNTLARNLPHAHSDEERRGIVRVALSLGAVSSVLSGTALYLLAGYLGPRLDLPGLTGALDLFAIYVGVAVFTTILTSLFQGYEDVRPNAYFVQILNPGLFIAFLGALAFAPTLGISLNTVLPAYVGATVASLVASLAYTLKRLPKVLPAGPRRSDMFRPTVAFALPLFAVTVAYYLSGWGDTLVLGAFDPHSVGTYSASVTMARLLTVGITALSFIFLPVAARYHRDSDIASIEGLYGTSTKWILLAALPFFLLFVFLPGPSLRLVYGAAYSTVTLPLRILAIGAFLSTLMGPTAAAQVAFAHKWLLLVNAAVAAAVDVGLSFLLVPSGGMTGAAVAWATAISVYPALSLIEIVLLDHIRPFGRDYWLPFLATAGPLGVVCYFLPAKIPLWTLPLIGLGSLVWYLAMVILTRSVGEGDRRLLIVVEAMLRVRLRLARRVGAWGLRSGASESPDKLR